MENKQNITCAIFENLTIRHHAETLPAREAILLASHLQQCPRCAAWQRGLEQCHTALDIAAAPDLPTDPSIHLQLREALIQKQTATPFLRHKALLYQTAVGIAAALLIFFASDDLEAPPMTAQYSSANGTSTIDTPIDSYLALQQTREHQRLVHFQNEDSLAIMRLAPRALLANSMTDSI